MGHVTISVEVQRNTDGYTLSKQRHTKMHTSGPIIKIRALNSSVVLEEPIEEGRLFHRETVLGKKRNFSGHHFKHDILYTVSHEMPLFFSDLVPGSGTYLSQETRYPSEFLKEG